MIGSFDVQLFTTFQELFQVCFMCFERVKGELFQALFFNNIVGGAIAAWVGFKEVMKDVGDVGGGRRCSSPGHGGGLKWTRWVERFLCA